MEDSKKRLLALIGLIVVTAGIGVGLYFAFFKSSAPSTPSTETATTTESNTLNTALGSRTPGASTTIETTDDGHLTNSENKPVAAIADGGVTKVKELVNSGSAAITVEGNSGAVQYYDTDTGLFHKILPDGSNQVLNENAPFPNARSVSWDHGSTKSIIEFPDGANVLYNFDTKQQTTLPSHWTEFQFAPNDQQIAAKKLSLDPDSRYLVIANTDGTHATNIEPLGENADKVQVSWSPNNQMIAFAHTADPIGLGREHVLVVGKNNENFKELTVEGLGFSPKWSPNGDILLYSSFRQANNLQPELWIVRGNVDQLGEDRQPLNVTTWVDKCTFATNTTIYCAVPDPDRLPYGIGFQPALASDTDDSIYKIDLNNGRTTLVAKPDGQFTIDSLRVNADESVLYFTDRLTGALEQVQLK